VSFRLLDILLFMSFFSWSVTFVLFFGFGISLLFIDWKCESG